MERPGCALLTWATLAPPVKLNGGLKTASAIATLAALRSRGRWTLNSLKEGHVGLRQFFTTLFSIGTFQQYLTGLKCRNEDVFS